MSKHVTDWLNAYLDGELKEDHLRQVEAHLVECQVCRDELESLARLSSLLHEVPAPEFTPPERFAAQVNLRLPRRRWPARRSKALEIGWSMIPVGLLGAWIFMGTTSVVNEILLAANNLGLLTGLSDWLVFHPASQTSLSATLAQFGVFPGSTGDWAGLTESLTRTLLPQIAVHVAIAFLYLGWLASWWARRRRQEQAQLFEG